MLRPYQRAAVDSVLSAIQAGGKPVLVAPTGSGKSYMGAAIASAFGGRVLWVAHRRELIRQAADHLQDLGLETGVIMAGEDESPHAPVQVASIQTLNRREMPDNIGLVIVDEAHHCNSESYKSLFYDGVSAVGLTATPYRLDGKGLGEFFDSIIVAAYPDELCESGVLHKPRVFAPGQPDMTGVKKFAGEFNMTETNLRVMDSRLIGDIVATWKKHAAGMKTVAFAVGIEHSKAIRDAFIAAGVDAEHIDGSTPTNERDEILGWLRAGEIKVLTNCMILNEGWDFPHLQCAVIARPTASLCLHLQMLGRIMRVADGKDGALVLDHAGNHHRHGAVTRRIEYSLDGIKKKKTETLGLKQCPACYAMVDTSEEVCPECGHVFEAAERREITVEPGELQEFDENSFAYQAAFWRQTEEQRVMSGYKEGWSLFRFKERFGNFPLIVDRRLINPTTATLEDKRRVWQEIEARRIKYGHQKGWTAWRYREQFGVWPRNVEYAR